MSCPCGSRRCVCDEVCYCDQVDCACKKCLRLKKLCSRCSLPAFVGAAAEGCASSSKYCGCLNRNPTTKDPDGKTEHETSSTDGKTEHETSSTDGKTEHETSSLDGKTEHETESSDNRDVSSDRHGRKAQSRKTRTRMSNWQAKKFKENSPTSTEDFSNTETVDAGDYQLETSSSGPWSDNEEQSISRLLRDMTTKRNFNSDSSTDSAAGNTSKTVEKYFETVEVMMREGKLPDAEAAAALDEGDTQMEVEVVLPEAAAASLDEEDNQIGMEVVLPEAAAEASLDEEDNQMGMEVVQPNEQAAEVQVQQHQYPLRSRQNLRPSSSAAQNVGMDENNNDPMSDSNRSTGLPKSDNESESD